jgi:hypothetical protein
MGGCSRVCADRAQAGVMQTQLPLHLVPVQCGFFSAPPNAHSFTYRNPTQTCWLCNLCFAHNTPQLRSFLVA